jgi:hypothetical protein
MVLLASLLHDSPRLHSRPIQKHEEILRGAELRIPVKLPPVFGDFRRRTMAESHFLRPDGHPREIAIGRRHTGHIASIGRRGLSRQIVV